MRQPTGIYDVMRQSTVIFDEYIVDIYGNRASERSFTRHARWEMWRRLYCVNYQIEYEDTTAYTPFVRSFMIPGDMIRKIHEGQKRRIPPVIMNYLYDQIPEGTRRKFKNRNYVSDLLKTHYGRIVGVHFPIIPEMNINTITLGE